MTPRSRPTAWASSFLFDRRRRVVTPTLARLRRRGDGAWGLRDLVLELGAGEGVALIGASGSGKTTLLRTMAGVLEPDEGSLDGATGGSARCSRSEAGVMASAHRPREPLLLGVLAGCHPPRRVRGRSG